MADQTGNAPPISLDSVRAKYPQYADKSDGELADALHEKFYSDMPKIQFYAKIGYDPWSLETLPHDLGQLIAGVTGGYVEPSGPAKTDNDKANRTAGMELWGGVGAAKGLTAPAAVRGAAGRFAANDPQTFSNAAQIAATAKTPPSTAAIPALSQIMQHPLTRLGLALGAGGSGAHAIAKRFGLIQ